MNRRPVLPVILLTVALCGCGVAGDELWFDGDLDGAIRAAAEQDTLVFVEFNTEWCSWCRRFETETLTDVAVREELAEFVAIQLDAEGEGAEAAQRLTIDNYPTVVFLDSSGEEVERIVGYLPPEKFVKEVRRIRKGDTLLACLEELEGDPSNIDAIKRAVEGLLERGDPEGAIARISAFHAGDGHDHELCRALMFLAGRDLHYRVYLSSAKHFRKGWKTAVEIPAAPGTNRLRELMDDGLIELDPEIQAERMRRARFDDAADLLDMVDRNAASGAELYGIAAFAFRGGHYGTAGDLYSRWFEETGPPKDPDALNRAAWQLYLAGEQTDAAIEMARAAYAAEPSPDIADTLARLLYISGDAAAAIELELEAAGGADDEQAADFRQVVERMRAGADLGDEPAFESFPGAKETTL
ncbi:MAG: thioredoxin fold domain-containing protein [Thermoanaerobaculales bacterium]|jgi:thioredoxin-related protein|nr:thioredoxin fold domain-containing protein [Thermoanaerobaculales bacterium]